MLKTAKKIGFFAFLLVSLLLISRDVKADIYEGEVIHKVHSTYQVRVICGTIQMILMCITTSGSITKEIEYTK